MYMEGVLSIKGSYLYGQSDPPDRAWMLFYPSSHAGQSDLAGTPAEQLHKGKFKRDEDNIPLQLILRIVLLRSALSC